MDGLFGFPRRGISDVQIFTPTSVAAAVGWTVWRKRPGASMVYIFALGGGGAGAMA